MNGINNMDSKYKDMPSRSSSSFTYYILLIELECIA